MGREVEFYRTRNGAAPTEAFLDMLSDKVVQKVIAVIELVETVPIVPAKYFKKLVGTELYEIRIRWKSNSYRLLCFFDRNDTVVITHGFMKKTQRTPKREIDRAERYRQDHIARRKP
jgi:phage-related protein